MRTTPSSCSCLGVTTPPHFCRPRFSTCKMGLGGRGLPALQVDVWGSLPGGSQSGPQAILASALRAHCFPPPTLTGSHPTPGLLGACSHLSHAPCPKRGDPNKSFAVLSVGSGPSQGTGRTGFHQRCSFPGPGSPGLTLAGAHTTRILTRRPLGSSRRCDRGKGTRVQDEPARDGGCVAQGSARNASPRHPNLSASTNSIRGTQHSGTVKPAQLSAPRLRTEPRSRTGHSP